MIWKSLDFINLPNLEISEYGDLRRKSDGFVYKKVKQNNGYLRYKWSTVHKLVALAFVPNVLNKDKINHIDGNKENNHFSNLQWCTHSENMKHAVKNNLLDLTKFRKNAALVNKGRLPWNKGLSKKIAPIV